MAACLGGLDVLVFTGGIGEHDAKLRSDVCARLAFLGISLDTDKNTLANPMNATQLHDEKSAVDIWMVPTDEGRVAAQLALELLSTSANT